MIQPILTESFYKSANPRGRHHVSVYHHSSLKGKFTFRIDFGGGTLGNCQCPRDENFYYCFGQFDSPELTLAAAKKVVFDD